MCSLLLTFRLHFLKHISFFFFFFCQVQTSWGAECIKGKAALFTDCAWTCRLHEAVLNTLCRFGDEIQTENFYIYNITDVMIHTIFKLNKQAALRGKEVLVKGGGGPPNKRKSKTVLKCVVPKGPFVPWLLYLFSLFRHKLLVNDDFSLLFKHSSLKLHSTPLKVQIPSGGLHCTSLSHFISPLSLKAPL